MKKIKHSPYSMLILLWLAFVVAFVSDDLSSVLAINNVPNAYELNQYVSPDALTFAAFAKNGLPVLLTATFIFLVLLVVPQPLIFTYWGKILTNIFGRALFLIAFIKLWAAIQNVSLWAFGYNHGHFVRFFLEKFGVEQFDSRTNIEIALIVVVVVICLPAYKLFFRRFPLYKVGGALSADGVKPAHLAQSECSDVP